MPPREEPVEVPNCFVQLVVALWPDCDDGMAAKRLDVNLESLDHAIRNLLAVSDIEGQQVVGASGRDVHGRDHQRAEVVALS